LIENTTDTMSIWPKIGMQVALVVVYSAVYAFWLYLRYLDGHLSALFACFGYRPIILGITLQILPRTGWYWVIVWPIYFLLE